MCRGLLHRDVKPGNLMVKGGRGVLIDFGFSEGADNHCASQVLMRGIE